ncbi:hypothetical protein GCM10029964_069200 [Kibdelosporangium lantanae]
MIALVPNTASAMPTDFDCTAGDMNTTLVYGGAGAGNRYAAIQFTANPGVTCTLPGSLPVDLVDAHDVLINNEAPADAPPVQLSEGSPAYVPLHWTAIAGPDQQQTPLAVTVTAPQESNPRGDYSDPNISLTWPFSAVDTTPESHTIDVGAVTQGTAPAV